MSPSRNAEIAAAESRVVLETYKKWPVALVEGQGAWVTDADGRRYLDLYGGHCVSLLGHSHPRWLETLRKQAEQIPFYSAVAHHPERARAAHLLLEAAPDGLERVFFSNSGAEANECALKMARKHTDREGVVSFEGSFHGRTLGALSATGNPFYHEGVRPLVPGHRFLPFGDLEALAKGIDKTTALVLVEPIQSMAGMRTAGPDWFAALRETCDRVGALLAFDEVQTGMGRTGTFYAAEWTGIHPDLLTLAKSIAGGFPAAATLVSGAVARGVQIGDQGSTFGGGPLACAMIACTSEIVRDEQLAERAARRHARIVEITAPLDWICGVRGRGLLVGLELAGPASDLAAFLFDRGILAGGSDDRRILRLMPPLVLEESDLDILEEALGEYTP